MKRCREILEEQLCIDYDCTLEELRSANNIFRSIKRNVGAREIGDENSILQIAVYREKLLVMADERLIDWCREKWVKKSGTWFSQPKNLIEINDKLGEFGQVLADTHHHYIPAENFKAIERRFPLRWYEKEEIKRFLGDDRFEEALLFDESRPDMFAVCAMEEENILGMASVTYNSEKMWEIGVNVTPEGRGKGIGTYVTTVLKEELLARGIVPTYATVESHIKSQKVAFQSGFEPAFYELFSS